MFFVCTLVNKGEDCILQGILVGQTAPEHILAYKHLLWNIDHLIVSILGQDKDTVVFAGSEKFISILDSIAQISVLLVVAQQQIPLSHRLDIHHLEAVYHSLASCSLSRLLSGLCQHLLQIFDIPEGILNQVGKLVVAIFDIILNLFYLLMVLVDVEKGNSPDRNLKEPLHVFLGDLAGKLIGKRSETIENCPLHLLGCLLGLYLLINPLLDEDTVQCPGIQVFQKMGFPEFLLCPENIHQVSGMVGYNLGHTHDSGQLILDNQGVYAYLVLAVGICIQCVDKVFVGIYTPWQVYLDIGLVGCVIGDRGNLELARLGCLGYRVDHHLAGHGIWQLLDDDALRIRDIQLGTDNNLSFAIVVARHIHNTAGGQIRIEGELLFLYECTHGIQHLNRVMRQNHGAHAHRNTFGTLDKNYWNLGREHQRLLGPAVVAVDICGQLRVIQHLFCKRQQPALNVSAGSGRLASKYVAVVSLPLYEQVTVGQLDQCTVDRGVAVGMVLHGLAHHVGHLVEFAVVHGDKGMEYAPLNRLKTIHQVWNSPVSDYIGGILQEIIFIQL